MNKLLKLNANKYLLQIYFYQIYNEFQSGNLLPFFKFEEEEIKKKYPDFLNHFNFSNINDLFTFIKIERRYNISPYNLPELLYCFSEDNEDTLLEEQDIASFPKLFDDCEVSPYNDLLIMSFMKSKYVYRNNGQYLDIADTPNLYDDGFVDCKFLNKKHFSFIEYDENNGRHIWLYKYERSIAIPIEIDSLKIINLIVKNNIDIDISDISENLRNNKNAILKILKSNNYICSFNLIDESLQNDPDFIYEALKSNTNIFKDIKEIYKTNQKYIKLVKKKNSSKIQPFQKVMKKGGE